MELSLKIQRHSQLADEREKKLINYLKKDNPNPVFIEMERQLIKDMREIVISVEELKNIDLWEDFEVYFKHYENVDKDGFTIHIPLKRNPKKERFIQIDLTMSGGVKDPEGKSNE